MLKKLIGVFLGVVNQPRIFQILFRLYVMISPFLKLQQKFHGPQPLARCGVGIVPDLAKGIDLRPGLLFFLLLLRSSGLRIAPAGLLDLLITFIHVVPPIYQSTDGDEAPVCTERTSLPNPKLSGSPRYTAADSTQVSMPAAKAVHAQPIPLDRDQM